MTSIIPKVDEKDWKKTESGLQYFVLKEGTGEAKPAASSHVTVNYEGKLLDGTVFDSSYSRNKSIDFPLGNVIKGWTEGVQLMQKGSVYIFKVPPHLGYGSQGAGGVIPPDSTLIFQIELIDFK